MHITHLLRVFITLLSDKELKHTNLKEKYASLEPSKDK